MKVIFTFEANKTEKKKQEVKEKDKDGKEIVVVKEEDVSIPFKFSICKPTNSQRRKAELFYNVTHGESWRNGMMTRTQVNKLLNNQEGNDLIFSKVQLEEYDNLKRELFNRREEYQLLFTKKDRTEAEEKKYKELTDGMYDIIKELHNYETALEAQFSHTAEAYCINKLTIFWLLHLAVQEKDGKQIELFQGENYDKKLESYDNFIDGDDDFIKSVVRDFTFLMTYWVSGGAENEDDFKKVLEEARKSPIF